jgi:uncharacterized protein YbbK (DUF523 family)
MIEKNHSCDGHLFDYRLDKEPVLVSACLLGIPCRWHGRKPKKREALIERLKKKYVLVPVCPEQLGGMPTPRTGEKLHGTGAEVLDGRLQIIAPETGEDVTVFFSYKGGKVYIRDCKNCRCLPCIFEGRKSFL